MMPARHFLALAALLAAIGSPAWAQIRRIPATLTALAASDGAHAGAMQDLALTVRLPEGFHVQSNAPRDPLLIATELSVDAPAGVTLVQLVFPPPIDFKQEGLEQPLAVFEQTFTVGVRVALAPKVAPGALVVPARLRYQACDDRVCYAPATASTAWTLTVVPPGTPVKATHADTFKTIGFDRAAAPLAPAPPLAPQAPPEVPRVPKVPEVPEVPRGLDDFAVAGTAGGYMSADEFLAFLRNAEAGVKPAGLLDGRGPLAILLIVLLGGVALNLTPCVLPMIPINLAIIGAGVQAGSRWRGLLLGGTYGAAMAVTYGALGLVVILTSGTFGGINASPWFNLGIAALFVVLGLAMFDVVTIDFSRWSTRVSPSARRGSFALAFAMGAVAALLAGACVAPVVIQVVLFAGHLYASGTSLALALPFVLGLGMALPWPIAGAGLSALPRPGPWMTRVKHAFGVLILGTAAYYGYVSYEILSSRWVDAAQVTSSVEAKLKEGWHRSLDDGLAEAARDGKPVLLDLWATWCKNCLVMDETTLKDPAVKAALEGYVKIKFQAEQPDEEPARSVMRRLGAVGLPAYAVIEPAAR